ncbi:MAG TPA: allantoinase AllB [Sporichthyaceae bacterium]|jgi:allantoinase|nr:allantoinase AllB [Sporichthyaceae bacterium]
MPSGAADLVIRARRAMLPAGERPAAVVVSAGRIEAVVEVDAAVPAARTEELGTDAVLLPGLVDTHVHVNEPGRTHWEGFATATRAAAAGGVTTLLDMPLNSLPPTLDAEALAIKRAAAAGRVHVDVGFWGGVVPGNLGDGAALSGLHAAGVFGFKCFLADSGVPEFPPLDGAGLLRAAELVAALDALLIVHAEDAAVLAVAPPAGPGYPAFLASRPPAAEVSAVEAVLDAARRTGARVHVLHLSAAAALPALAAARAEGVPVTVETCPHYLTLNSAAVLPGATEFKCCPPVRDAANCDALWAGLRSGVIDAVVSDHSPSPPELKRPRGAEVGDFATAWGGVSSLQLGLPVVWTAARSRGIGLGEVSVWMSPGPARLAGLGDKGAIVAGAAADLVEFAPDEEFTVVAGDLAHRHPITPYAGRRLSGVVRRTWLGGTVTGGAPAGRLLSRGEPR